MTQGPRDQATREIHVWYANLGASSRELVDYLGMLDAEERERAASFRFSWHRDRFVAAHGILRMLLSSYAGCQAGEVSFRYGARGKPSIAIASGQPGLGFSLAHSGALAAYAVAREQRIGIDLEVLRPAEDVSLVAERVFTTEERATLDGLPPLQRVEGFFRGWTRKEAYLKATGEGLSVDPQTIAVSVAPGEPAEFRRLPDPQAAAEGWSLFDLTPTPDAVGALAAPGQRWTLVARWWNGAVRGDTSSPPLQGSASSPPRVTASW